MEKRKLRNKARLDKKRWPDKTRKDEKKQNVTRGKKKKHVRHKSTPTLETFLLYTAVQSSLTAHQASSPDIS